MAGVCKLDGAVTKAFTFWFDRELRFDISGNDLEVHTARGEKLLATLRHVEDTKGIGDGEGSLFVTNLRLIWSKDDQHKHNISIGYYTVQGMEIKQTNSRLRGPTEALYIKSKFQGSRFEFIFTYLVRNNLRLFSTAPAVWRAYDASRLYRDMRLRSSVIRDGNLVLLQGEQLIMRERGVSNVSEDKGHMGILFTTNLRIAWTTHHSSNLNVSIPFMQVIALRVQNTKFGNALVVETSSYAGSCILGFRIDPVERLRVIFKETVALWKAWTLSPVLGVAVVLKDIAAVCDEEGGDGGEGTAMFPPRAEPRAQDGENVVEEVTTDAFAAYYADVGQKGTDRRPEYDATIGLAVEKLRLGTTLRDLWAVVT